MLSLAKKLEACSRAAEEFGVVVSSSQGTLVVRAGVVEYSAHRALSCLVAPEPEDHVLLAVAGDGRAFVLAVLERPGNGSTALEVDGDLKLRLKTGRFSVSTQEGFEVATCGGVSMVSAGLEITSGEAVVHLDRLSYLGRLIHGQVERVKLFASSLDSVVDRLWQRVKRSFRFVEELDHLEAEEIQYRAKNNAQIHGQNALVTAERLVKVDGGQIHLG
jgi:hypothetical protein